MTPRTAQTCCLSVHKQRGMERDFFSSNPWLVTVSQGLWASQGASGGFPVTSLRNCELHCELLAFHMLLLGSGACAHSNLKDMRAATPGHLTVLMGHSTPLETK